MPADGLTKDTHPARMVTWGVATRGGWRIIYDPDFTSARRRCGEGRNDLLGDGVVRMPMVPEYQETDIDYAPTALPLV